VRRAWLLLALLVLSAADPAAPPEPGGLWTGPLQGPVPATIAGGKVIHTSELDALRRQGGLLVIDVSPAPRKPEGLAPNAPWMPPAHRDIAGSVWLAEMGRGVLAPAEEAWHRARLAELTRGRLEAPIAIYCHPRCWASWNAAKRAIGYGYRRVYWYPDGIEGWRAAGLPMATAEPLLPPS